MRAKSISDFRKNIAGDIDQVVNDLEPLIVTRSAGKDPVVVMALSEYEAWKETVHLNSSRANADRLARGHAEFEAGKGITADWPE